MENGENSFKVCTICKRPKVPFDDTRKSCEPCRAKARERSRVKKVQLAAQLADLGFPSSAPPQSQTLELQASKSEVQETRNTMVKVSEKIASGSPGKSIFLQYQKASSLYDALRVAISSNASRNFAGCHSIVQCENIDHATRAKMVANDLRKIVKIPFKYKLPFKSSVTDTKVRVKYSCSCNLSPPKTLTSAQSSNLPSGHTNLAAGVACSGTVIITVRDDCSHPLGIPGQQIIVEIVH